MNLTTVNVSDVKLLELLGERTDHKGQSVYFFDWVPTNQDNDAVANQVQYIKECQSKGIPAIIFDRHSSMSEDEVIFLHKKMKVKLFEPAIITRPGFEFMPYWIHFREYKYSDFKENRRFQTGYKGDKFTKDLESNILSVIKDGISVGLDVKLPTDKYDVLKSVVCIDRFDFDDLDTMILTGTKTEYERGILPDITHLMEVGTLPCLYHKHKWLHSLFRNFVIYDNKDLRWMAKLYQNCGIGFIEDMQKNILEYLPEMEAGNFVDNLLEKINAL